MENTEADRSTFPKGLLFLLGFTEAAELPSLRRRAYRLLADLAPDFSAAALAGAVKPLPPSSDAQGQRLAYEHNSALAYLESVRRGRVPVPSCPSRDERRALPREVLTDLFLAVVDGDRETYGRALHELVALAERGDVLTEQDLERPR